jgi:hypothetical protein
MATNLIEALPLGIGEGVTEFLPVSSTGHLTIAEGLLGLQVDDPGVTALTAIIQIGAMLRPGEAGRFLRRWQRRHAAVEVGCSTNDRHGGSRRRGQAGGSIAEVVDPSILLADYQAKVERLIPASERGPG